jgi:phage gpG-like protein
MMEVKIDQAQLDAIRKKLSPEQFKKAAEISLKRIGDEMQKDASGKAPIKSGKLKQSIVSEPSSTQVRVGTDLIYARIHEFGGTITAKKNYLKFKINGQWIMCKSVRISARPYMTPAFERQRSGRAVGIFTEEFNRILSK